jgi:molecular chaperone IbpA
MTTFDLSPLWRSSVGFDEFDRLFDSVFSTNNKGATYPPYNIVKYDKNIYQITMAIAGFDQDQINISQEGNLLTVKGVMGNDKEEDKTEFLYRGIANRNFERKFELADTVKVIKADLKNGLLSIDLEREIPEHQKPRNIQINTDQLLSA